TFVSTRPVVVSAVTVTADRGDVTAVPDGSVAVADAVFVMEPASMSDCVTVWSGAVHRIDSPAARDVRGHVTVTAAPPEKASLTDTALSAVLPVLVMSYT